jgi:hypothetical protein
MTLMTPVERDAWYTALRRPAPNVYNVESSAPPSNVTFKPQRGTATTESIVADILRRGHTFKAVHLQDVAGCVDANVIAKLSCHCDQHLKLLNVRGCGVPPRQLAWLRACGVTILS